MKEFSSQRRIRKGNPYSPFLFLIVWEILNCMLTEAKIKGIFTGINIHETDYQVSHLQSANDNILFINNDLKSEMRVKHMLQCFELLSGLKINF